jgi:hypothetical protein
LGDADKPTIDTIQTASIERMSEQVPS